LIILCRAVMYVVTYFFGDDDRETDFRNAVDFVRKFA